MEPDPGRHRLQLHARELPEREAGLTGTRVEPGEAAVPGAEGASAHPHALRRRDVQLPALPRAAGRSDPAVRALRPPDAGGDRAAPSGVRAGQAGVATVPDLPERPDPREPRLLLHLPPAGRRDRRAAPREHAGARRRRDVLRRGDRRRPGRRVRVPRGSKVDSTTVYGSLVLWSMPTFWVGLLLVFSFGVWFKALPISGISTPGATYSSPLGGRRGRREAPDPADDHARARRHRAVRADHAELARRRDDGGLHHDRPGEGEPEAPGACGTTGSATPSCRS